MNQTPTVIDKEYWKDPVHVMNGLCWGMMGWSLGVITAILLQLQ